jgi:hypothetical protein
MKRLCLIVFTAFLLVFCGLLNQSSKAVTDVGYSIKSFVADYYLDIDKGGHSTLRAVEKITATFSGDNKHGILRKLVSTYEDHFVDLNVNSVTNENGVAIKYTSSTTGGYTILKIGDDDQLVKDEKTYVITYTSKDVTRTIKDGISDEFYWNVNGNGWDTYIGQVAANIHIAPNLIDKLNGNTACYYGLIRSTSRCLINQVDGGFESTVDSLSAKEGVTIAIGFESNVFTKHVNGFFDNIYNLVAPLCALFSTIMFLVYLRFTVFYRGAKSIRSIIPQYVPLKDFDVISSAMIMGKNSKWVSAAYIGLAVRDKIKIIEVEKKSFRRSNYRFELLSIDGLSKAEFGLIEALFGRSPKLGSVHESQSEKKDKVFLNKLRDIFMMSAFDKECDGYLKVIETDVRLRVLTALTLIPLWLTMWVTSLGFYGSFYSISYSVTIIECLIVVYVVTPSIYGSLRIYLTRSGRDNYDYLMGLKMYIEVGERERLRILQSPSGVEKFYVDTNDKESVLRLNEQLLPYAVLFGLEKEWSKVVGDSYTEGRVKPSWYDNCFYNYKLVLFSETQPRVYSDSSGASGGGVSGGGGGGGGGSSW